MADLPSTSNFGARERMPTPSTDEDIKTFRRLYMGGHLSHTFGRVLARLEKETAMSVRTAEELQADWETNHHPGRGDEATRFYIQREGAWDWQIIDRKSGQSIIAFPYAHLHEARGAAAALNAFAGIRLG